jgi:hypothetical protein
MVDKSNEILQGPNGERLERTGETRHAREGEFYWDDLVVPPRPMLATHDHRYVTESEILRLIPPEPWLPMKDAPRNATDVRVKLADGTIHERAHWAEDLSGSDQPPFTGWFIRVGDYFSGITEAVGWQPLIPPETPPPPIDEVIIGLNCPSILECTQENRCLLDCANKPQRPIISTPTLAEQREILDDLLCGKSGIEIFNSKGVMPSETGRLTSNASELSAKQAGSITSESAPLLTDILHEFCLRNFGNSDPQSLTGRPLTEELFGLMNRLAAPAESSPSPQASELAERIRKRIYDLWSRSRGGAFGQASWQGFVRDAVREELAAASPLRETPRPDAKLAKKIARFVKVHISQYFGEIPEPLNDAFAELDEIVLSVLPGAAGSVVGD